MTRIFIVNLVLLFAANLLVKPLWVFEIDLQVQNLVGAENYGLYAAMLNFTMLPGILLDLGMNQYNNSQVAKSPGSASNFFAEIFPIKIFLIIIYFIFTILSGIVVGYIYERTDLFIMLILIQVLAGMVLFLRTYFSGLHLFKTDTILSISDKIIMLFLCGYLLLFHKENFKIEWFIYCQIFSYIFSVVFCFILLSKHLHQISFKFKLTSLRSVLKQGLPFAILSVLMILFTRSDTILLERILPNGKFFAGLYAQCYRLLDAVNMIAILTASLLFPIFLRMLHNNSDLNNIVKTSIITLLIPACCLAIQCNTYSENWMNILYKKSTSENIFVFGILMISFIPMSGIYIFGTLLTAAGKLKLLIQAAIVSLLLNLILNIIFIPSLNIKAAGISALVTQSIFCGCCIYFSIKNRYIKFTFSEIMKYIFALSVLFISLYILKINSVQLFTALCFTAILYIIIIFALRIIKISEIRNLLQPFIEKNKNER